MSDDSITIKIPGSTSNLGSGFDTLGLALRLYSFVRVSRVAGKAVNLPVPPDGGDPEIARKMAHEAARAFFRRTGARPFGLEVHQVGGVPVARGLGASAVLRLGVAAGLNELANTALSRQQLLELVAELEGHPDNASPAVFGGFTVSGLVAGAVRCLAYRVSPKVEFVTLFPRYGINTKEARKVMPSSYSRGDTAHALNRAALITAAFASGKYEALRGVFDDRMHQPCREKLIPQLSAVIRAGEQAGAIGGFLSGSGSAIICVALNRPGEVAQAMQEQLPESTVKILTADNQGFAVAQSGAQSG